MSPRVAYLGLGNMGKGMASNMVKKAGLATPLVLYNRTTARADALSEVLGRDKTAVVATIREAVEAADIIFTCMGDDAAIRETMVAAVEADVKGKLFVDSSTVHPDTTKDLAWLVVGKGAEFVACPVFGAPAMADNGQLICVLAGPASSTEKVKPFTKGVIGRALIDLSGQEPGKATLLKLVGNTFILNMVESLAQGLSLAEKSGLGVDNLHQYIEIMFPGPYAAYSTRMRDGDYFKREKPLFAVDLALKDVGHALELANKSSAELPNMEIAKQHLLSVKDHQGKTGDIASIYGAVRKESGLSFENDRSS